MLKQPARKNQDGQPAIALSRRRWQAGFSTIEILVAFVVVILSVTAVISLIFGGQVVAVDSQTDSEATQKAQAMLENARATAIQNFDSVVSLPTVKDQDGIDYYKTLTVGPDPNDPTNGFKKLVTANVAWTGEAARNLNVQLATFITNPIAALGGDTCNPTLSGDWKHPQVLGYADVVSPNGASDVNVLGKKAYVTSNPSSATQEDFYIFDVSDPNQKPFPQLRAINTGPGLVAEYVAGKYAYVANTSINSQLQIIDISNPAAPFVAKSFKIPGVTGGIGSSIFYANKKVYLGLNKTTTGPEFNVIDVSDPLNPNYLGGWSAGTKITSIIVKDDKAYLATPMPTPATPQQENLSIVDVSNPASISRLGTFTAPDPATQDGESLYLAKDGKTLYLGRTVGGVDNPSNHEFFVLNVDTPASIASLGSVNIARTVNAIALRSNYAFMITGTPNLGFQIWDVSNPASITLYSSLNIEQTARGGMDCDGNLVYVAQRSGHALQIIGPGFSDAAITTTIYNNANGQPVTTVVSGTVVYDKATLTGSAGTPTGTVDFTIYTNKNNCSGTSQTETEPLVSGVGQSSTFTTLNKDISYKAHYSGDGNYNPVDGACEPLTVN